MNEPNLPIERFRRTFLLALVGLITAAFLWMIRPFLTPLLLAAILTGLSYPLQQRISRFTGG